MMAITMPASLHSTVNNTTLNGAHSSPSATSSSSPSPVSSSSFSLAAKALLSQNKVNRPRSKSTHCLINERSNADDMCSVKRSLSTSISTCSLNSTRVLRLGKEVIALPNFLEHEIKVKKNYTALGIQVDCEWDEGVNGCVVKGITTDSAVERDARLKVGDFILALNNENMRKITNATAKAILKRASLTSSDIV